MSQSLNNILKNEIELMREILSNLHQEELALLENDRKKWGALIQERSDHVLSLQQIRHERLAATDDLAKMASKLGKKEPLAVFEDEGCEVLSKLDQIFALIDRMNLQNCRNEVLFDQAKQKKDLPLQCSFPHPLHKSVRVKTKTKTYTK